MKQRTRLIAWLGLGLHAAVWGATPACPQPTDIEPSMLLGPWQIEWRDTSPEYGPNPSLLELSPHPDYSGSLRGRLTRGAQQLLVAADWDDDTLTMEESADGQRIDATWQATAADGQCARVLEGLRYTGSAPDASARRFRMHRRP